MTDQTESFGLRWTAGLVLALATLTAVIYGPFYDNPFIFETTYYFHHYREVLHIPLAGLVSFDPIIPFQPVTWYLFSVICYLFGMNPLVYFTFGFSLHLINTTLTSILAFRLSKDRTLAALAALIFFLSYLHSETLLWKNAQYHALGGFWFLLSLIAYIHHRNKKRRWAFLVSLMFFYLAVFTDQAAIGLVAICFTYDLLYPHPGPSRGRTVVSSCLRLTAFLPAIGLSIAISLYRGNLMKRFFLSSLNPMKNLITILSHPWYPFGPQGVTDLYRQSSSVSSLVKGLLGAPNAGAIVALLLCAAGTGALLAWRCLRGTTLERFGCLFYLLAFIPFYPHGSVDKRLFYIPLMGLSLALAYWVLKLWLGMGTAFTAFPRGRTAVRFAAILLLLGWVTYQVAFIRQMGHDFRTAGTLFSRALDTLDQLAPSFGREDQLFIKGLPTAYGHTYVFSPFPDTLQEYLRLRWKNPTLRVHWVDQGGAFPRPFPGARFLIYQDQQLVEVDPSRERSGP